MNTNAIREFYDYHFVLNRRVWDECIMRLTDAQFVQDLPYSIGSIRNQTVHMMDVDAGWFARLKHEPRPPFLEPSDFPDRAAVRIHWDHVEAAMRDYLKKLQDADLWETVTFPTRRSGMVTNTRWQILLHVVNHATDHRAQLLAMLFQLGAPTLEQDFMLYLWEGQKTP